MRTSTHLAFAVAAASFLAFGAGALAGGKGKPSASKAPLSLAAGAPDLNAKGVVDTKHFPAVGKRVERSWLRFRLGRLDGTDYTLWMDDPVTVDVVDLVQTAVFTAGRKGGVNYRFDTKVGPALPFGDTLADLYGKTFEVRDALGVVVLTGAIPAPPVPGGHGHGHSGH